MPRPAITHPSVDAALTWVCVLAFCLLPSPLCSACSLFFCDLCRRACSLPRILQPRSTAEPYSSPSLTAASFRGRSCLNPPPLRLIPLSLVPLQTPTQHPSPAEPGDAYPLSVPHRLCTPLLSLLGHTPPPLLPSQALCRVSVALAEGACPGRAGLNAQCTHWGRRGAA